MKKETIIKLKNLTKNYPVAGRDFSVLKGINLSVNRCEFLGIIGPSGSGKTTLLNIIGSLDKPTNGEVNVLNKDIKSLNHKDAAELRNFHIGFIFQVFNLLPVYTVFENVEFALLLQKNTSKQRKNAVMKALEWVGLTEHANKKPDKLSGGESQRVAIARAICDKPNVLFFDEPTSGLDPITGKVINDLINKTVKKLGVSAITITHDISSIDNLASRVILLDNSKIAWSG